jgi:multiple sugar transport system ATP-binding protein
MGVTVELDRISKSFGRVGVLKDISLSVQAGEFLTLLGPSGCGKSTLLRIIAGLELQESGHVRLGGEVVDGRAPKSRNVAMVFQSYALYPHMTVAGNIGLPLTMNRLSAPQRFPFLGRLVPGTGAARRKIAEEVRALAGTLGIETLLDRKPSQLSGGQKQRVAVARAMVRHPSVFLMDEPLSNLDANLRVHMRGELTALHRRLDATLIYVTHDQTEAMTMSDRVGVMKEGRLIQVGAPREIYSDPASLEVAEFVGSPKINLLPARAREAGVDIFGAPLAVAHGARAGRELTIGVRAEALSLAPRGADGGLRAAVSQVEDLGSEALVYATVADGAHRLVMRTEAAAGTALSAGADVTIVLRPDATLVFDGEGRRMRVHPPVKQVVRVHG